jgi:hypothetical protein
MTHPWKRRETVLEEFFVFLLALVHVHAIMVFKRPKTAVRFPELGGADTTLTMHPWKRRESIVRDFLKIASTLGL